MKLVKLTMAMVLALGVAQVYADSTNLVQTVRVQLLGFRQGGTRTFGNVTTKSLDTVNVDTRRVIQALAAATGSSISSTGRLVLVTPLRNGFVPHFEIRDGSTTVDVSGFITYQPWSGTLETFTQNSRTGRTQGNNYSIRQFALHDNDGAALTLHFDVNGIANGSNVNNVTGDDTFIDASGSGDREGDLLLLQGTIGVFGHTLESVPDGDSTGGVS